MVCGEIIFMRVKSKVIILVLLYFKLKNYFILLSETLHMKKFLFALILPAFFIFFGCNNKSEEAVTLKFNLPAGSSYDYNVDMDMAMDVNVNGQSVNMKNKVAMG